MLKKLQKPFHPLGKIRRLKIETKPSKEEWKKIIDECIKEGRKSKSVRMLNDLMKKFYKEI